MSPRRVPGAIPVTAAAPRSCAGVPRARAPLGPTQMPTEDLRVVDPLGQLGHRLAGHRRARRVHLQHHGLRPGPLGGVEGPLHLVDHDLVDQPGHLDHVDRRRRGRGGLGPGVGRADQGGSTRHEAETEQADG